MNNEETKLPPNSLEDVSSLEAQIKEAEKENETSMQQRIKDIKKGVNALAKVKDKSSSAIVNNAHHGLASLSVLLYTMAHNAYYADETMKALGLFSASLIAYSVQNVLHTLKVKVPIDLSDWLNRLGEKTGFVRQSK